MNKPTHANTSLCSSFFWAGYECAYALLKNRKRLDLLEATRHDEYCRIDYTLIKQLGITTVREGLAWNMIDQGGGTYDFSRFTTMMRIAKEEGIEQIWNLNHFDFPSDVDPFSSMFVYRFSEYAKRCIETIRKFHTGTLFINPINEISFFSFIGAEVGAWAPFKKHQGVAFKKQLVKASVAAMEEMNKVDRNVRFIQIDPLMYRKAKRLSDSAAVNFAENFNDSIRFQTFDMLSGKYMPELGGNSKYVDIIGMNYYFHNQEWIIAVEGKSDQVTQSKTIPFHHKDRMGLDSLLMEVYERYHRPIVLTETGSYGSLRAKWWKKILEEIKKGISQEIPIVGVCAYPAVDRPDWDKPEVLTNSGLWDFKKNDPDMIRIPHRHSIAVIKKYSTLFSQVAV